MYLVYGAHFFHYPQPYSVCLCVHPISGAHFFHPTSMCVCVYIPSTGPTSSPIVCTSRLQGQLLSCVFVYVSSTGPTSFTLLLCVFVCTSIYRAHFVSFTSVVCVCTRYYTSRSSFMPHHIFSFISFMPYGALWAPSTSTSTSWGLGTHLFPVHSMTHLCHAMYSDN